MSGMRIVVIGAGGHGRVVASVLQETGAPWVPAGVLDTGRPRPEERVAGLPVLGGLEDLPGMISDGVEAAVIAIGNGDQRAQHLADARGLGLLLPAVVSEAAYVAPSAILGEGSFVGPFGHVGPDAVVGEGAIVNTGADLEHESHLGAYSHLAPGSSVAGRAQVGSFVFVGMGARIVERITVADETIVGANAVVARDVDSPGLRLMGVPARVR